MVDIPLAGGGEEGFALPEGDQQQVALAGFVPEHAFAVNPGGVIGEHTERRFDLGAAGVAVNAQRHRQRPGQGVPACQSTARESSSGRHWRPLPNSWTVSINQARRSRSPSACSSGGDGSQAVGLAEGDWEVLETFLTRNSPMLALLRDRDGSRVTGAG